MKKLKAFTKVDLIVVIGMVLVLFGASLTMLKKNLNKTKDEANIQAASTVMSYLQGYYETNFNMYPTYSPGAQETEYAHAVLDNSQADGNFLKLNLKPNYSKFIDKFKYSSNLVYVYKTDGSEAAVVIRKFEQARERCNTSSPDAPELIKEYLLRDPTACYYVGKS